MIQCGRPGFNPWVGKIPWRRKWQSTPVLLPGKSHGQRSLVGYSPWGRKELDTTEWLNWTELKQLTITHSLIVSHGLPKWLNGKEYACSGGDKCLISGLGRSPGEGNGNPLQYSCLENPRDRGAWWAAVYGVAQSRTWLKRLSRSSSSNNHRDAFIFSSYCLCLVR